MPSLTERRTGGNFVVSEASGLRSRAEGVVAPGTALRSGQLIAKRDSDNTFQSWNPTGTPPGAGQVRGIAWADTGPTGIGTPPTRFAYIAADAEVNADELDFNGATSGQTATGNAALLALGIIPREGI
jgi:hypothetical protein